MDEPLQYDPRAKQQIVNAIYAFLYDPVSLSFQKRLDGLIIKNSLMLGVGSKAVAYKGQIYAMSGSGSIVSTPASRLAPALKQEMDEYLKDVAQVNEGEMPFVMGFIRQVLNSSNDMNDYLRVLPRSVHHPVEKLILSCPCRSKTLTEAAVSTLLTSNEAPINLMKRRMVLNLLV